MRDGTYGSSNDDGASEKRDTLEETEKVSKAAVG